jgi:uncharacterized membrane protein
MNEVRSAQLSPMRTSGWLLLTWASVMMAWAAFSYVTGNPQDYDSLFRAKYIAHLGVVWSHGVSATLALALGPFQFWTWLRVKHRAVHRTVGYLYMLCMLAGGVSGVIMGLDAHGGVPSRIGFSLMAVLWMVTAAKALQAAVRRDFLAHRMWMIRNFALTFGAVLLRVYLYSLQHYGFAFDQVYPFVTWGAWLPNIIVVELWLRASFPDRAVFFGNPRALPQADRASVARSLSSLNA